MMLCRALSLAGLRRRGTVAAIVALTFPLLIGVAALALDGGLLYLQRRQAQSTADAGALAGAYALSQGATFGSAQKTAVAVGSQQGITISSSQVTQPQVGSIAVTVTSTKSRMFSAVFGSGTMSANASATAVALTAVNGFNGSRSASASLLPIVLDKATWQLMMAGQTTDQFTFNPATNTVTTGGDGIYESMLYPVSAGLPGNWGTIEVGVNNNGTSTLSAQITGGITPAQLATFPNSTIQLDPTLSPPSITFSANPGLSAGIKSALTSIIGQPVTVPIYDSSGGNGSNAWYQVIAFQPAVILSVSFHGNNNYVIMQPAVVNDPTAIAGPPQSWSQGGLLSLRLTQ
jgi:Flp pilus assembly protein TadG